MDYRARYYDPTIGRFISEDPIGFGGGHNFYAYALNNLFALLIRRVPHPERSEGWAELGDGNTSRQRLRL